VLATLVEAAKQPADAPENFSEQILRVVEHAGYRVLCDAPASVICFTPCRVRQERICLGDRAKPFCCKLWLVSVLVRVPPQDERPVCPLHFICTGPPSHSQGFVRTRL